MIYTLTFITLNILEQHIGILHYSYWLGVSRSGVGGRTLVNLYFG